MFPHGKTAVRICLPGMAPTSDILARLVHIMTIALVLLDVGRFSLILLFTLLSPLLGVAVIDISPIDMSPPLFALSPCTEPTPH